MSLLPMDEEARCARIGAHVMRFARQYGWRDDGEGAFEFIQRHSYIVGQQDAGAKLPDGYNDRRWPITAIAGSDGWKEAAIAWQVCASIHEKYGKRDPFYTTRRGDFLKHGDKALAMYRSGTGDEWYPASMPPVDKRQVLVELVPPKRKKKDAEPRLEIGRYFRPEPGVHDDDEAMWSDNLGEELNVARWRYL